MCKTAKRKTIRTSEWGSSSGRAKKSFAGRERMESYARLITTHNIWAYVRFITIMHKPCKRPQAPITLSFHS